MNWTTLIIIIYASVLLLVCLRIIYETHSSTKTIAYLLFCIFAPVVGILFYLTFGVNYWRKKLYSKKSDHDVMMLEQMKKDIRHYNEVILNPSHLGEYDNGELAAMLIKDLHSPLTRNNTLKILVNGEEKFPELMDCLSKAKHHIQIEY